MALSPTAIKLIYQEIGLQPPSPDALNAFVALSANGASDLQIDELIGKLPEATTVIDPLVRLYQGAFGRVPDAAGLAAWAGAERAGEVAFQQIAHSFVNSAGIRWPLRQHQRQRGADHRVLPQRPGPRSGAGGSCVVAG